MTQRSQTQKCSGNTIRARAWSITLNNFTDEEETKLQDDNYTYLKYQVEHVNTTHIQGMLYYKNPRTFTAMKKKYPRAHIEVCIDTEALIEYCGKPESRVRGPYEFGIKPEQGKRSDLKTLHSDIKSGKTVKDIRQDNPEIYHQYGRTLNQLEDDYMCDKTRTRKTIGVWIWGVTGVGKSYTARNIIPKDWTIYEHPVNDKGWWDGYKQQDAVIIDDFRGEIKYNEILKMIDEWGYKVPRRGREPLPFTSDLVIITSSLHPRDVYYNINADDSIKQLIRRFDWGENIICLNKDNAAGEPAACTSIDGLEQIVLGYPPK